MTIPGLSQRSKECEQFRDKKLRRIATSKEEDEVVDGSMGDGFCYFTDKDGVTYSFSEAGGDVSQIFRIEVLDLSAYHGPLFADIAAGDSYPTVYWKLMAHAKDFPVWTFGRSYPFGTYAETTYCITDSSGYGWSISLQFDYLNRLKSIDETVDMRGGDDASYNDP